MLKWDLGDLLPTLADPIFWLSFVQSPWAQPSFDHVEHNG
jgi:hypothetical protein